MRVVVTEQIADIAHDVDAVHADLIVCLEPEDRTSHGYAQVRHADPVARHQGVAVVLEADAMDGVPDPTLILVRDTAGTVPSRAAIVIRRVALPVLLQVDPLNQRAWLLREILGAEGQRLGVQRRRAERTVVESLPPAPLPSPVDEAEVEPDSDEDTDPYRELESRTVPAEAEETQADQYQITLDMDLILPNARAMLDAVERGAPVLPPPAAEE